MVLTLPAAPARPARRAPRHPPDTGCVTRRGSARPRHRLDRCGRHRAIGRGPGQAAAQLGVKSLNSDPGLPGVYCLTWIQFLGALGPPAIAESEQIYVAAPRRLAPCRLGAGAASSGKALAQRQIDLSARNVQVLAASRRAGLGPGRAGVSTGQDADEPTDLVECLHGFGQECPEDMKSIVGTG